MFAMLLDKNALTKWHSIDKWQGWDTKVGCTARIAYETSHMEVSRNIFLEQLRCSVQKWHNSFSFDIYLYNTTFSSIDT